MIGKQAISLLSPGIGGAKRRTFGGGAASIDLCHGACRDDCRCKQQRLASIRIIQS
jgi:hypothetical protein